MGGEIVMVIVAREKVLVIVVLGVVVVLVIGMAVLIVIVVVVFVVVVGRGIEVVAGYVGRELGGGHVVKIVGGYGNDRPGTSLPQKEEQRSKERHPRKNFDPSHRRLG